MAEPRWTRFTKRTDGLKLDWLRKRLTDQHIPWRTAGRSFHAPILEVPEEHIDLAWRLLTSPMEGEGKPIDDIDDDDPRFALDVLGEAYPWDLPDEFPDDPTTEEPS